MKHKKVMLDLLMFLSDDKCEYIRRELHFRPKCKCQNDPPTNICEIANIIFIVYS